MVASKVPSHDMLSCWRKRTMDWRSRGCMRDRCAFTLDSEPPCAAQDARRAQLHPDEPLPSMFNMIVDASDLRAALVKLLHAKGVQCDNHSIRVSMLAREEPPVFYLV